MTSTYELWNQPDAGKATAMLVGWRQWANAGAVSSGLPQYLVQQTRAKKIGRIHPDGFYIFQLPGTHELMRPLVKFNQGLPEFLQSQQNEFYYAEINHRGLVILIGDEPHLDVERYTNAVLDAARELHVQRIIGLSGIYNEVPFDKERMLTCNYSLPHLKAELEDVAVTFSNYQGGASIGSYLCRRAREQVMEYIELYALVPSYDFSTLAPHTSTVLRIETDAMAWLGAAQRIAYLLKMDLDLSPLEIRSRRMVEQIRAKVEELEAANPGVGIQEYLQRLSENFEETPFIPLDEIWEENLHKLLNKFDPDENTDSPLDE